MGAPQATGRIEVRTALRGLAEGASVQALDDVAVQRPEEALSHLLDLNAIVRVGDHLSSRRGEPDMPVRKISAQGRGRSVLRSRVEKKVQELRDEVKAAFASPYTGRRPLPDAATVLRLAQESGALEARDEAQFTALAETLRAQARERFDHQFARMRQRVRWMRTDLTADARKQGPVAKDLDALDAVLTRALEAGVVRAYGRLEHALDVAYSQRLTAALRALPPGEVTVESLAPAFAEGGPLAAHALGLGRLLVAMTEQEISFLMAWLDASSVGDHPQSNAPSRVEESAP